MSAASLVRFLNESPTPFHAVQSVRKHLQSAGYTELTEQQSWPSLVPGGRYFLTRHNSTVLAFSLGTSFTPSSPFFILGGHTDSPVLKVRSVGSKKKVGGASLIGVQTYGGGQWATWVDRDLGLAGRIIVREGGRTSGKRGATGEGKDEQSRSVLVHLPSAVARVSTLAIHMNRTVNSDGAKFNAEDQLCPQLLVPDDANAGPVASPFGGMHEGALLRLLAAEAKVAAEDIVSFDLSFVDASPATLSAGGEYVLSGRLDNLMTVFTGMHALTAADATLGSSSACRLAVFHDHEEVGSVSAIGADSQFVTKTMDRIAEAAGGEGYQLTEQDKSRSRAKSFLLSSDSAHAIHPQWSSKHVPELAPHMNAGVTVKMMMNQRYITNDVTQHLMDLVAERAGVPLQYFSARNDCTCGSTIGPMSASNIGVRGVDLGIAQLSMHSIREVAGARDIDDAIKLFEAFFSHFEAIDESVDVI